MAGLLSSLIAGLAKIVVRKIGRVESSNVIVFYFPLFTSLMTLPFALYFRQLMSCLQLSTLLLMALFGTFGRLAITKAYTIAKAGLVGLFSYFSVPIAGVIGWLLWNNSIKQALMIGTSIIVLVGLLSFVANSQQKIQYPA